MGFRGFRQIRDRLKDESGQSIILISVVILSFLMFFSFAINTGLLINAKISVQSAADAAAYAGAAVQGRQLNAISFLNYDMREQYKKFIFRYTFVGSMGSYKFPQVLSGSTGKDYDFEKLDHTTGTTGTVLALKVPVVCIPLTNNGQANDNCLVVNLTNTANQVGKSTGGLNPIQDTLIQNLLAIAQAQNSICNGQGSMNIFVLMAWLFRGDTNNTQLTQLIQTLGTNAGNNPQDTASIVNTIGPLVSDLGLFPRNIITGMRAHTLEKFLNQPHESGVTSDSVDSWTTASDSDARERTIQAFRSAEANLNTSVFDSTQTSMDELQADHLITLSDILINFNAYVQHISPNGTTTTQGSPTNCISAIDSFPVIGAPVGVQVSNLKVNYGVHLHAFVKPHGLLFLPNSDALELDAYAGAKPFGSRIGPAVTPKLTTSITPPPVNGVVVNDCSGKAQCDVPYLDIGANYSNYATDYLTDLKTTATASSGTYSLNGIINAQTHAMAPTPEEVGHYNILPTPKTAANLQYDYIPYSADPKVYRFYAPVFPAGQADVNAIVAGVLSTMFDKTQVGLNAFGFTANQLSNQLQTTIVGYINNALANGGTQSENGETTTFAAVTFPMPTGLQAGSKGFWLVNSNQVLSSWAPGSKFIPRFGYSVKFATLRDLQNEGMSSDDDDIATVVH